MAFPQVLGMTPALSTADTTTHVVALPSGCDVVNRLLLVFVLKDGTGAVTWPAGWTAVANAAGTTASSNFEARWRLIAGTEGFTGFGDSITVTGASEEWISLAFLIAQHAASTSAPIAGGVGTGSGGTSFDPLSLTSGWGALDTLWFAIVQIDTSFFPVTYPANYGLNNYGENTGGSTGVTLLVASRELNAASADAGAFTSTGAGDWRVLTIAVRPGAEGALTLRTITDWSMFPRQYMRRRVA